MMNQAIMGQIAPINSLSEHWWIFLLVAVWVVIWKGIALWKAARLSHKWWFIILLVANTVGLLEMFYIFFIARKYSVEEKTEESVDENK